MFDEQPTLYDVLDLKPDATPTEIREAYIRIKNTFQRDNVALYSLIDPTEREETLNKIEEAYAILSNPQKRKEYDRNFGQLMSNANVVSLHRDEPIGIQASEAPLSNVSSLAAAAVAVPAPPPFTPAAAYRPQEPAAYAEEQAATATVAILMPPPPITQPSHSTQAEALKSSNAEIDLEIEIQTEWAGHFLRKVREARRISLDEITSATRISKAYLMALEEEQFAKLPAAVYIRGFVAQLAKILRIPPEAVTAAYMERCKRANPEKFK